MTNFSSLKQPLSMLPTISVSIEGMLKECKIMYKMLKEAEPKPHVLDNATVLPIIEAYEKHGENYDIFDKQLKHWQNEKLNDSQKTEINRLIKQMKILRKVDKDVLDLANKLKENTIEKILARDDIELAMEVLMGKRNI